MQMDVHNTWVACSSLAVERDDTMQVRMYGLWQKA